MNSIFFMSLQVPSVNFMKADLLDPDLVLELRVVQGYLIKWPGDSGFNREWSINQIRFPQHKIKWMWKLMKTHLRRVGSWGGLSYLGANDFRGAHVSETRPSDAPYRHRSPLAPAPTSSFHLCPRDAMIKRVGIIHSATCCGHFTAAAPPDKSCSAIAPVRPYRRPKRTGASSRGEAGGRCRCPAADSTRMRLRVGGP